MILGNGSESCACHSQFWKLKSRSVRGKYFERLRKWKQLIRRGGVEDSTDPTVHMWSQCPMGGKHAAEFACGFFLQLLKQTFAEGMAEVLTFCIGLSESELQSVTHAYSEGKEYVLAMLVLKLQYWTLIPWTLCGLFHWNTALAIQCALDCLAQYNQRPTDPEHHRISVEFLSPAGLWRDEVIKLSQGAPLHTSSFDVIQRCIELGLVPCVERIMEAHHAYVQQRLRP